MIDTSIKVKMVTLDDLKDLESAPDEKAFYKVIKDSWKLTNATDGLYLENIDYTAEGLSEEDLAAFLGVDISAYGDDSEERAALQNDLSDAYQMREDEVDARVCWLARDEIISETRDIFKESHLYAEEDDTKHLRYIKPATYEEMEKAGVKTTKNALREVGYAIERLAPLPLGEESADTTITVALNDIKLVSKYTEEEVWNAAMRFSNYWYFTKYTGDDMPVLYMTDWGDELRRIVYYWLEDCEWADDVDDLDDKKGNLPSFVSFLQGDDFERVYSKADLEKHSLEDNAAQVLGYALDSFIKWAQEQEQDNSTLQSLKTRLAENSALAFDKAFRTSLAEELQKLLK
ncbi:hypothetical protein HXT41_02530 [Gardnerella sp. DNF01189]|uniref:hypothetical protein n=1 Tax=Gardnerella sp. DNF01189 TaxID=2749063 RepID=UPI002589E403|nr:hypothetical protein [uncultured Gardnerella sp.]